MSISPLPKKLLIMSGTKKRESSLWYLTMVEIQQFELLTNTICRGYCIGDAFTTDATQFAGCSAAGVTHHTEMHMHQADVIGNQHSPQQLDCM